MNAKTIPRLFQKDDAWFWVDDLCEEPMGPFQTFGEAWDDFKNLRREKQSPERRAILENNP